MKYLDDKIKQAQPYLQAIGLRADEHAFTIRELLTQIRDSVSILVMAPEPDRKGFPLLLPAAANLFVATVPAGAHWELEVLSLQQPTTADNGQQVQLIVDGRFRFGHVGTVGGTNPVPTGPVPPVVIHGPATIELFAYFSAAVYVQFRVRRRRPTPTRFAGRIETSVSSNDALSHHDKLHEGVSDLP